MSTIDEILLLNWYTKNYKFNYKQKKGKMFTEQAEQELEKTDLYLKQFFKQNPFNLTNIESKQINEYTQKAKNKKNSIDIIQKIFKKIKPIDQEIILFRGVKTKSIPSCSDWFSTSIAQSTALDFMQNKNCCLLELYIQPGVKLLPIYLTEFSHFDENEVIVQGNGVFEHVKDYKTYDYEKTGTLTSKYKYHMPSNMKTDKNVEKNIFELLNSSMYNVFDPSSIVEKNTFI